MPRRTKWLITDHKYKRKNKLGQERLQKNNRVIETGREDQTREAI